MKVKIFEATGMVAMEKCGKWGLFEYAEVGDKETLLPLDFAQNLTSLEVYENNNLIVTPEAIYSLDGEKLLEHGREAEIIKLPTKLLIVTNGGKYGKQIAIWDNEKILFKGTCTSFRYSNEYLALNYRGIWSVFKTDGEPIDEGAFRAEDVEIHHDLLIAESVGRQDLYSLKKKDFLKKDQTRIVCSDVCNLALCARIGETALSVFCNGRWHQIPDVTEFGLIDGMDHMFYVKRGEKFFIYEDMHRFMKIIYPNGVDFVACHRNILMIMNDGETCFYNHM